MSDGRYKAGHEDGYAEGYDVGCIDTAGTWRSRVRTAEARVAELEAALKFYADKMSWVSDSPIATPARRDQGRIARAALQRDRRPG